ncbi:hypothetical protein GJV26_24945 [Massilia dura]|uniref:Flagellar hook-length control protein FliK n=1 Tax=Pseudoduganella dura TaxID=321982 RepID=A0A6I3XGR0_9BURK|nr:hypothetical protein [Pseudoduganella dura]MUI15677.1 hypothetical protein [Pseudoduganella dura]GGX81597.1 hypothetical protein GCM10007386_10610 [Pseudoduganella dura]
MAIDRVTPSSAALTIPERFVRERPGQSQTMLLPARPQDGTQFTPPRFVAEQSVAGQLAAEPGVHGAVGALLEAMEGPLPGGPRPSATLAGALAAEALLADAASMQPNQLFMSRQLAWHPPEPSAMAASWMAMVRTYAEQRTALLAQAQGRHVPASVFLSDGARHVLRDGRVPPQLVSELDAWRFAVYAWGAEKLVLRVVVRDPARDADEGQEGASSGRRLPHVALRLEIHLPGLGKVVLQLEAAEGGAVLEIGAAQAGAMQHMRAVLPEIGDIARRCGVRILRVRLMRELPAPGTGQPTRIQVAMLTPPLFKAMAEVAVRLSQPAPVE